MLNKLRFKIRRSKKPWVFWARFSDYCLSFLIYRGSDKKLAKTYAMYLTGASSPKGVADLIIGSNFLSKGQQRHSLVKKSKLPYDSNLFNNLETNFQSFDIRECITKLKTDGFCKLPVSLPLDFQDELNSIAKNSQVVPTKYAINQSPQSAPLIEIDHIWDVQFPDTVKSNAAKKLIQDRQLLQIAAGYLQVNPVVIGARLYWSLSHSNEEFLTAENWHVDAGDGLSFVKVFFALTDINQNNGPTGFIKGTHTSLPREFYSGRRFHQSEIEKKFGNRQIEATGERGTVYMVDTRGLHRGTPVKIGKRLLFHFLYGSDFYGFARPTTFNLERSLCFGDIYSGQLARTFAAFRSDSPESTHLIKGP